MGVLVEGKQASAIAKDISHGAYSQEIAQEKTELTAEELKELEEERKKLAAEVEKRRTEYTATAKTIIDSMAGKTRAEIKAKLVEAGVPTLLINELLPVAGAAAQQPGAAPVAGAAKEKAPAEKGK